MPRGLKNIPKVTAEAYTKGDETFIGVTSEDQTMEVAIDKDNMFELRIAFQLTKKMRSRLKYARPLLSLACWILGCPLELKESKIGEDDGQSKVNSKSGT